MNATIEVRDELIRELPDMQAAIRACIQISGLQLKAVAFELGLEPNHLSKMLTPSDDPRHFPPNKLPQLMTVCRNEIPLRWLLLARGYSSPRSVVELEAEAARLRAENAALRAESKVVFNVFKTLPLEVSHDG